MTSFIVHLWTTEENGQFFLKTGGYYYHKQLETDLNFNVAHIFIGPFFTHHVRIFLCGQRYHIKTPGQHQMISKIPNRRFFFHYLLFQIRLWSTAVYTALLCFKICLKLASRCPEMLPHCRKRCLHHHTFYFRGFVDLAIFLSLLSSHVVYML